MAEKVIVAVDGGLASRAAIEWVIERSKTVVMEVEITSVVELGWMAPGGEEVEYRTPYEQALKLAHDRLEKQAPHTKITTSIKFGLPAEALILASEDADLLVIGTNKTGTLAGILHGTLPLKVAGRAKCTTIVVPTGWTPRTGQIVAGWDDDGTADAAVDFAVAEAMRLEKPLLIVHAWRIPAAIGEGAAGAAFIFDDLVKAHEEMLRGVTTRVRRSLPALTVKEKLEAGPIVVGVVGAAAGASLLVVGSHGRGVIGGLILGSVSHDVLLNMPAPVAVVPKPNQD